MIILFMRLGAQKMYITKQQQLKYDKPKKFH